MFSVEFDSETGLIECVCQGYLTVADVLDHDRAMRAVVDRVRRSGRNVRVLVHANSAVQSAEVMNMVVNHTWMPGPGEREALIVVGMLAKLQTARLFDPARVRPFLSEAEAREWLAEPDFAHAAVPLQSAAFTHAKGI